MSIVTNIISKLLKEDENEACILTFCDFEQELSEEYLLNYINEIIKNNPILKQTIIKKNNQFFLCDIESFNINKCFSIKYSEKTNFNTYIKSMLNKKLSEYNFYMFICINRELKKSRIFFKIHHSYADGYKLMNMLTEPLYIKKEDNKPPAFKREKNMLNSIYYYTIGTVILFITTILILLKNLFTFNKTNKTNKINKTNKTNVNILTDYIICKSLSLDEIKQFAIENNITINDFLYALMIKTDKIYTKKERIIQTVSPINVSKLNKINNFCPILNNINNSYDNINLLEKVNNTFNNYKYSLFIPMFDGIINNFVSYINPKILLKYHNKIINNSHYIYSNVIGPPIDKFNIKVSDIKFLITAKSSEIVYNIISSKNNINIVCSFKKGIVKDKKYFKKCIYKAYKNLMNTNK